VPPALPVPNTSRYPRSPVAAGHVESAPRRLRGVLEERTVLDDEKVETFVDGVPIERPRSKFS
jgi:hypothetical protein